MEFKDHVFSNLKRLKIDGLGMYQGFSDNSNNFVKMFPAVERLSILLGFPESTMPPKVINAFFEGLKSLQVFEVGPSLLNEHVVQYIG